MIYRIAVLLVITAACSKVSDLSDLSGHFENMNEKEAEEIVKKYSPQIIEEHAKTDSVIISGALLSSYEQNPAVAEAILESGSKLIVITEKNGVQNNQDYVNFLAKNIRYENKVQFVSSESERLPTVWARDWAPLKTRSASNLKDQIYLEFNYFPFRVVDDYAGQWLENKLEAYKRLSMPVYNEGGNFMVNSRGFCLMTEQVLKRNQEGAWKQKIFVNEKGEPFRDEQGDIVRDWYEAAESVPETYKVVDRAVYTDVDGTEKIRKNDVYLDEDQVTSYFKRYAGCKKVVILPMMPFEGTGHIDMFAKFIDDETVILNQIKDEQLGYATDKNYNMALEIQSYLEKIATILQNEGLKTQRMPMPLPQLVDDGWGAVPIIRSYTNSLLIDADKKVALVPRYKYTIDYQPDNPQADLGLLKVTFIDDPLADGYEASVALIYQSQGYEPKFINSDDLIRQGGAIHCVTMQVPANQ